MSAEQEYIKIIQNEKKLTGKPWKLPNANEIGDISYQIAEVAESSLVLRSFNNNYKLTKDKRAFESVGAHTNLMITIVDRALSFLYKTESELLKEGYSYREIMEAARLHDLPENLIGDKPDNGFTDDCDKKVSERFYYNIFFRKYHWQDPESLNRIRRLLEEMDEKSSRIGKLLYCADKVSAIIITLQCDRYNNPPLLGPKNKIASKRDLEEMSICDGKVRGLYRASEMWTIDWFKARKLIDYDETGFFTSLIIMRTLQVRGKWYNWREKDY